MSDGEQDREQGDDAEEAKHLALGDVVASQNPLDRASDR